MLHVLTLSVIAVLLSHPQLMDSSQQHFKTSPTPLNDVDFESSSDIQLSLGQDSDNSFAFKSPHSFHLNSFNSRSFDYEDLNICVLITFCTFIITLLMVFGAIKGKPSYLMPFFCLQVFDFCISSFTAIGYLCILPDMHRMVAKNPQLPFQNELLQLNPQCLSLLIFLVFVLAMLVKAYMIGVIWSCYKYLTLRQVCSQRTIHYIDSDVQVLLPDYDSVVKKFPQPPPSYTYAMTGQQQDGSVPQV
uniref:Lysosomal-associated transmembrane protein 4A n=1 Tax=Clastoptera arizonana TaxID=38151 RepID=A0A1B6D2N8_9HEMI